MTLTHREHLAPLREVVRRSRGSPARSALRWPLEPRFGYGRGAAQLGRRAGRSSPSAGTDAVALSTWGAGEPRLRAGGSRARSRLARGRSALLVLAAAHREPAVLPGREDVERPLAADARLLAALVRPRCATRGRGATRSSAASLALKLSSTRRRARSSPRRRPRCPSRSAAAATGTTASLAARRELDARRARPARLSTTRRTRSSGG